MDRIDSDGFVDILRVVSRRIADARVEVGELDGASGDADHGASMAEGFAAAVRAAAEAAAGGAGCDEILRPAAVAFLNAVGATTGPLYASAFLRAARRFDGQPVLPPDAMVDLVIAMSEGIAERGKAEPGDKTMMDAWAPAARAATAARLSGASPLAALAAASAAASAGRDATRAMVASKGRAARLGERGIGHLDPGAASAVIIIDALHEGLSAALLRHGGVA